MAKNATTKKKISSEVRDEIKDEIHREMQEERQKLEFELEKEIREEIAHKMKVKRSEVEFTIEEAFLTLVGAIAVGLGPFISARYLNLSPGSVNGTMITILATWFGLLVFVIPIVKKIDQLIERLE